MNVLVLMCDHLRYDAIACHGNPHVRTPNLDRLAARSVRFTNAFCNSPLCGPTRHSLATGLYPYRHGVVTNSLLPVEGMRTIAHRAVDAGWRAECFGHMHWQRLDTCDGRPDVFPDHGYQDYQAIHHDRSGLTDAQRRRRMWEELDLTQSRTAGISAVPGEQFYARQIADASIRRLRDWAASGQRFLSWTSFDEPHPPFFTTRELYAHYAALDLPPPLTRPDDASPSRDEVGRNPVWNDMTPLDHRVMKAGYYGLVEMADRQLGRVLDALDELRLWDNTLVLFTVDHGEMLGDFNLYAKSVMWEQAVHVPFFLCHPGIAPGERTALAEHVDVLPTICDCLGLPVPDGTQGRSLKPWLTGAPPASWREYALAHLNELIMVRTERWKLVYQKGVPAHLFDLREDPRESFNRIADRPDIARDLNALLERDHPDLLPATRRHVAADRRRKKKLKPDVVLAARG